MQTGFSAKQPKCCGCANVLEPIGLIQAVGGTSRITFFRCSRCGMTQSRRSPETRERAAVSPDRD
jgi:hypothetical protein